jgi:hypothetical protein
METDRAGFACGAVGRSANAQLSKSQFPNPKSQTIFQ